MIPQEIRESLTKLFNNSLVRLFLLIALAIFCQILLIWFPKDNLLEEDVEEIILEETGLSLDLSP